MSYRGGEDGVYPTDPLPARSLIELSSLANSDVNCPILTYSWDSCTLVGREETGVGNDTSSLDVLEPFAQPVESGTLSDVNPSIGDVLQLSRLPVYLGGSIIVDNPTSVGQTSSGSRAVVSDDPKGCIHGGLDPEFSPLKTRSARRRKGLISDSSTLSSTRSHSPWALREQKALARGST